MSSTRIYVTPEDTAPEPSWVRWVILLVGVLSVVAGIILVFKPSHSLTTLAVIFGIFLLIDGIGELIGSFGRMVENRALAAIVGVLGIVFGILLIRHPSGAVTAIGLLIGIWMVAAGIVRSCARSPSDAPGAGRARGAARGDRRNRDRLRPPYRLRDAGGADRDLADPQRDRPQIRFCGVRADVADFMIKAAEDHLRAETAAYGIEPGPTEG